jgi:hypothetical protein
MLIGGSMTDKNSPAEQRNHLAWAKDHPEARKLGKNSPQSQIDNLYPKRGQSSKYSDTNSTAPTAVNLVPFAVTRDASELLLAYVYKNNCTVSQAIRDKFVERTEHKEES